MVLVRAYLSWFAASAVTSTNRRNAIGPHQPYLMAYIYAEDQEDVSIRRRIDSNTANEELESESGVEAA